MSTLSSLKTGGNSSWRRHTTYASAVVKPAPRQLSIFFTPHVFNYLYIHRPFPLWNRQNKYGGEMTYFQQQFSLWLVARWHQHITWTIGNSDIRKLHVNFIMNAFVPKSLLKIWTTWEVNSFVAVGTHITSCGTHSDVRTSIIQAFRFSTVISKS